MRMMTLALLAGFASISAQAQNVTLYGIVDTGIERLDNVGASGDSLTRIPTISGSAASRWGLRGSEDLGGGLKANFVVEGGFATDTGAFQQGNRLFGRQAYLGLQGSWGAVTLGRQYSMLVWSASRTDPLLTQIYGPASFDIFIGAPRTDNAIAYQGKFGGLALGALYSFGRDNNGSTTPTCAGEVAGDSKNCRQWSAFMNFDTSTWGIGGWIDESNNAAGQSDKRKSINGFVMLGTTKLAANYIKRDVEAGPESDLWSVAVVYPMTATMTLEAAYYDYDLVDSANDASMIALRGTYALSKRTNIYATMGHMSNEGASTFSPTLAAGALSPAPGKNQTGVMIGLRHSF